MLYCGLFYRNMCSDGHLDAWLENRGIAYRHFSVVTYSCTSMNIDIHIPIGGQPWLRFEEGIRRKSPKMPPRWSSEIADFAEVEIGSDKTVWFWHSPSPTRGRTRSPFWKPNKLAYRTPPFFPNPDPYVFGDLAISPWWLRCPLPIPGPQTATLAKTVEENYL